MAHYRPPPVGGAVVPKYCAGQSNSPREGERSPGDNPVPWQKHSLCGKPTEIKTGEEQFHLSHKQRRYCGPDSNQETDSLARGIAVDMKMPPPAYTHLIHMHDVQGFKVKRER